MVICSLLFINFFLLFMKITNTASEPQRKTAVVIGATGLVGQALVNKLAKSPQYSKIVTITRRKVHYDCEKVDNHAIDFSQLSQYTHLVKGDVFFSCLGTTLKQAGSVAAQRVIDYDYQIAAAKLACNNHIPHYVLVSSSGANAQSRSSYLKMKGELDAAVKMMPFKRISIIKPSLLLGERNQLRIGEKIAGAILPLLCRLPWLKRFRPIHGSEVAETLFTLSLNNGSGFEELLLDDVFPHKVRKDNHD